MLEEVICGLLIKRKEETKSSDCSVLLSTGHGLGYMCNSA